MMTIVPNSLAREEEKSEVKGEYGGIWGEEEGDADYGGMVRPSQQDVAPYETGLSGECKSLLVFNLSRGHPTNNFYK